MPNGKLAPNPLGLGIERPSLPVLWIAAALFAASIGALGGTHPTLAVGLVGAAVLMTLAFLAPAAHLLLLLFVTGIIPFGLQNSFALGGGAGSPGLLLSDVLLAGGLLRAAVVLFNTPLDRRQRLVLTVLLVVLGWAVLQFVQGYRAGNDLADAGLELRTLLGLSAAFIALPILMDPDGRRRLLIGLVALGLALGLWGLAQWILAIPFNDADLGVREGIDGTTQGRGQLQGGLFGFPVAIVVGLAAVLATSVRSAMQRRLLVLLLAVNGASLVLTYERTFWISTLAALLLIVVLAAPSHRTRALIAAPASVIVLLSGFALLAPAELTAARERLLSVDESAGENSLRYRLVESRHVVNKIEGSPLLGSGLGATVTWRPFTNVPFSTESYSHNGFLWAAWKLGIPGALLLVLTLCTAMVARGRARDPSSYEAVRTGAQVALGVLLVANLTFPTFNGLSITVAMGLLVALCITPAAQPRSRRLRPASQVPQATPGDWQAPTPAAGSAVGAESPVRAVRFR